MASSTRVVGVFPPAARAARTRLFDTLEQVFPIRFEGRAAGEWRSLAGLFSFETDVPGDVAAAACPILRVVSDGPACRPPLAVRFTDAPTLDRRLRGQTLEERTASNARVLAAAPTDQILATCEQGPLWLRQPAPVQPMYVVGAAPQEVAPDQPLRHHLRAGQFLGLLPLVQFLRDVTTDTAWTEPPLRAAFIFDDPNLHALSYGYLRYPALVEHARRHGYHAVVASIPLDYRFTHAATARLFREHANVLSLTLHGNNHDHHELLRADSDQHALGLAAEALRRAAAFERRHGLRIARVMCPPHEVYSDAIPNALFRLGYDAITTMHLPDGAHGALGEWYPARFLGDGLPRLARRVLFNKLDRMVLDAYLNLPLLLFGHHQDVADGLEPLAAAAARVNSLGQVTWASLADIMATNFATRRTGSRFRVRLYARRAAVPMPADVDELVVEAPDLPAAPEAVHIVCDGQSTPLQPGSTATFGGPFASVVQIDLVSGRPLAPDQVAPPARRVWPVVRRALTEGRDRTSPLRQRLRSR